MLSCHSLLGSVSETLQVSFCVAMTNTKTKSNLEEGFASASIIVGSRDRNSSRNMKQNGNDGGDVVCWLIGLYLLALLI